VSAGSAASSVPVDATEQVAARLVEIGDTVLNVNGWWRVVALDNHGDHIDLWLGERSRPFRERKRPDDLVARASGQLTPPTSA
jgi:hypothetical protein